MIPTMVPDAPGARGGFVASLWTGACACGASVEGTPRDDGTVSCPACGRVVVADPSRAARVLGATASSETGSIPVAPSSALGTGTIATPVLATALTRSAAGADSPATPDVPARVPSKLGPYRVLGRLGEGGQGFVFRGHDDVLDRPVALKILARSRSDELSDIEREARSVATVSHPNVVQVYSAGDQAGLAWFAMELVPGPDLREVLEREGPLDETRARRYLAQAARGLGAAQRKGVFHRDVKPANLLLDKRDDTVKVADFGLAQRGSVATSLSRSALVGGTPLYVAPEVIREGSGDERADIYSLGATFFHLVAGQPPFGGTIAADALVGHATRPAPDVRTLRPGVSPDFAQILARCLEKDPAARFQSYDALAAALEIPLVDPEPERAPAAPPLAITVSPHGRAPAPPPARPPKAAHPPRRGRFLVLLVGGLVLASFVRQIHAKNERIAAARAERARVSHARGPWGEPSPPAGGPPRARPSSRPSSPWGGEFEAPPLVAIPTRERFPLSVEPAFSQVAWSVRMIGARTFPDELSPARTEKACGERVVDSSGRPLARACATTHLPYAIVGPASTGDGLVAWHVHDRDKRVVLCVDQDGNERATTILQLLLWLHARADEQGVPWETVVRRVKPYLPGDVDERELEQIDETYLSLEVTRPERGRRRRAGRRARARGRASAAGNRRRAASVLAARRRSR